MRAYVTISGGSVLLVEPAKNSYTVYIEFKNSGTTPAYKFLTRIEGDVFAFGDMPFRDVPPHDQNQSSILGPGDRAHINTEPAIISPLDLEAVRRQQKGIFVWGSAEYADIFGNMRSFRYRCRVAGHEGTFLDGRVGWMLKPHPLGYDAN